MKTYLSCGPQPCTHSRTQNQTKRCRPVWRFRALRPLRSSVSDDRVTVKEDHIPSGSKVPLLLSRKTWMHTHGLVEEVLSSHGKRTVSSRCPSRNPLLRQETAQPNSSAAEAVLTTRCRPSSPLQSKRENPPRSSQQKLRRNNSKTLRESPLSPSPVGNSGVEHKVHCGFAITVTEAPLH